LAANLQELGREILVWLVATVAALGVFGQLVIALHHGLIFDGIVWSVIVAAILFAATSAERVKQLLER